MITVFTPTYNRGHLLNRLYESLVMQRYKDFEWIIVDDGSTDGTQDIVSSLILGHGNMQDGFPIRYFKKENGGKHTAINLGVKTVIIDYKVYHYHIYDHTHTSLL